MIYCARDADKCGREIFRHAGRGGYTPRWRENANRRRRCFRSAAGETCAAAHTNPPWLSGLGWMPRTEASKAGCMGFTRWKPLFAAGRALRGRRMFDSRCEPSVPPKSQDNPRALSAVPHTRLPRMPLQFGDTSASMWYDSQIQLNHLLGSFPFRRSLTPRNAALLRLVSFPLASMDNSLRNLCRFHRTFFFYIICLCAAGRFRRSGGEQRALRPPFAMLRSASLSSFSISIE